MPTCNTCGEEITWRSVDGVKVPMHLSGRWCSGQKNNPKNAYAATPFSSAVSYSNPNAQCPVCGQRVFYYQSPNGGRVFFNHGGWPWPKHGCTDNTKTQIRPVKSLPQSIWSTFRNTQGEPLEICRLNRFSKKKGVIELRFSHVIERRSFRGTISTDYLFACATTMDDLNNAPSFVVRTYESHRWIDFISGRKQQIDTFKLERSNKTSSRKHPQTL